MAAPTRRPCRTSRSRHTVEQMMPRALIVHMTLVVALSSGDQRMSPEETVRRYCALEFDGQTLTPEGRSKRAALLAAAPLARPVRGPPRHRPRLRREER